MTLREQQVVANVGRIRVTELWLWQVQGWVAPPQDDDGPVFDKLDFDRIHLVCEQREVLEIDEEGIPVLLSMVDQIHGLRRSLKFLAQAVDEQSAEMCRSVLTSFQAKLQSER